MRGALLLAGAARVGDQSWPTDSARAAASA